MKFKIECTTPNTCGYCHGCQYLYEDCRCELKTEPYFTLTPKGFQNVFEAIADVPILVPISVYECDAIARAVLKTLNIGIKEKDQ